MLENIFGNESASKVFLHIFHYGEIHASGIGKDYQTSITPIKKQLQKFEESGILKSKLAGKTRLYSFNEKSPWTKPLKEIIKLEYNSIPLNEKQILFGTRRRPRRQGKPIL